MPHTLDEILTLARARSDASLRAEAEALEAYTAERRQADRDLRELIALSRERDAAARAK